MQKWLNLGGFCKLSGKVSKKAGERQRKVEEGAKT